MKMVRPSRRDSIYSSPFCGRATFIWPMFSGRDAKAVLSSLRVGSAVGFALAPFVLAPFVLAPFAAFAITSSLNDFCLCVIWEHICAIRTKANNRETTERTMEIKLTGKTALVTGGSKGLG